ncbi:MAG: alpha/beta hydrolase [Oscillatoriaceae cyanobacterium Prado104]|nr:alpha/beta hydrolase [Oscillatoriaceae cyanobacterium Prado104]
MKLAKFVSIASIAALAASVSIFSTGSRAQGAEKIVLTFGPLRQAVNIEDLENFSKNGDTTPTLKQIIRFSKQDPQLLRGLIGLEIGLKPANLARVVYSTPGEKLTDEIGQAIRTQRRTENGKALRAAVILAAGDDGKVSLLEILRKYPLPEVYVDVASIGATVAKVQSLAGSLQTMLQDATRSNSTTETTRTETTIERRTTPQPVTPPPSRVMPVPSRTPAPQPVRGLY